MELKSYQLPLGWQVTFPDFWEHEYNVKYGQNIFYPPDSDLTFRITAFHAENQGIPAPAAIMETVLLHSLDETAQELPAAEYPLLADYQIRSFRSETEEDGKAVLSFCTGFATDGDLLVVNIFGSNESEMQDAAEYLKLIMRNTNEN